MHRLLCGRGQTFLSPQSQWPRNNLQLHRRRRHRCRCHRCPNLVPIGSFNWNALSPRRNFSTPLLIAYDSSKTIFDRFARIPSMTFFESATRNSTRIMRKSSKNGSSNKRARSPLSIWKRDFSRVTPRERSKLSFSTIQLASRMFVALKRLPDTDRRRKTSE